MSQPTDAEFAETFLFQEGATHVESKTESPDREARYKLTKLLGRGGLGEVHEAVDLLLSRSVAMKSSIDPHPGALDRFWHEARVTAVLDHPNIVPVYDGGNRAEGPFFTMKKVEGQDVFDAIVDGPAMSLRQKLDIFRGTCDAIEYAHAKGWLHRDLKPENIMLGPFGEVLVVDWGIACELDARKAPPMAGTLRYMAPEQAKGETLDARADVYALGSVLWFLLSEDEPFPEEDPDLMRKRMILGEVYVPTDLPGVPPELLAIVRKAMAKERHHRYPSVHVLKNDLLAYIDGEEVSAFTYSKGLRAMKWANRHWRPLVVGLAASTLILSILGFASMVSGVAVFRSAQLTQTAADQAMEAEGEMQRQWLEALVAGSSAHVSGERYRLARAALDTAEGVGTRPFQGLSWSDLTTRGVWPIAQADVDGALPTAIATGSDLALLTRSDGTWETRDLKTGSRRTSGRVPGRPLVVLDARRMLSVDGADLVLVDAFDGEIARTPRAHPKIRVESAWMAGDQVLVQSVQDGVSPTVTAWSVPDLQRQSVASGIEGLLIHGVGPWGRSVIGSRDGRVDQLGGGEVVSWVDGLPRQQVRRLQGFLGRDVVYEVSGRLIQARDLSSGDVLWERTGFPGILGVETRGGTVAIADREGRVLVLDASTGEERAMLLGLEQRPLALQVDRSGQWIVAAGVGGRLASWHVPETPVDWWLAATESGDLHPEGRLLVATTEDAVRIVDVPSATTVFSLPFEGRGGPAVWSPEGDRVALVDEGHLVVWNPATGERRDTGVNADHVVWGTSQVVVSSLSGVRRLHPKTLAVTDKYPSIGTLWSGVEEPDGSIVLGASKRADNTAGFRVSPGGPPVPLSGGAPETVGYGVALAGEKVLFGRQDGQVLRHDKGGEKPSWSWQAAPITDLVETSDGVLAVGLDGRVHAVNPDGLPVYSLEYSPDPLFWVEASKTQVVVGGEQGIRTLPLDGRPKTKPVDRMLSAHAWSLLVEEPGLTPEQRLTVALGSGEGLEDALKGVTSQTADLLRSIRK